MLALVSVLSVLVLPTAALASVSISLSGGAVTLSSGQNYSEPGYSAFSTVDGNVTSSVNVTGGVNASQPGTYVIGYSVTDSALDSDFASRLVTVEGIGGGDMPFCSGPMAPGWNVSLPDGGCGGSSIFFQYGALVNAQTGEICQFWSGCMVKKQ